ILAIQEHTEVTAPWRQQQNDAAPAVIAALAAKWPCPAAGRPHATNRRAAIPVTAITKWSIAVARAGAFNCPTREPRPNRRRAGSRELASPSQGRRAPAIILGTFGLH